MKLPKTSYLEPVPSPKRTDKDYAVSRVVSMLNEMSNCVDLIKHHNITQEEILAESQSRAENKSKINSYSASDLYNSYTYSFPNNWSDMMSKRLKK